jgi:hypothetical protein
MFAGVDTLPRRQGESMVRTVVLRTGAWLRRRSALVLLVVTVSGLAVGGLAGSAWTSSRCSRWPVR